MVISSGGGEKSFELLGNLQAREEEARNVSRRLERAERAIEEERAAVVGLQQQLADSCKQVEKPIITPTGGRRVFTIVLKSIHLLREGDM